MYRKILFVVEEPNAELVKVARLCLQTTNCLLVVVQLKQRKPDAAEEKRFVSLLSEQNSWQVHTRSVTSQKELILESRYADGILIEKQTWSNCKELQLECPQLVFQKDAMQLKLLVFIFDGYTSSFQHFSSLLKLFPQLIQQLQVLVVIHYPSHKQLKSAEERKFVEYLRYHCNKVSLLTLPDNAFSVSAYVARNLFGGSPQWSQVLMVAPDVGTDLAVNLLAGVGPEHPSASFILT
jgi:hypothetical protein